MRPMMQEADRATDTMHGVLHAVALIMHEKQNVLYVTFTL